MASKIDGICVVIAAHNAEATIGRAVASAISQAEVSSVIVVDDASGDGTAAAARHAGNGADRLRVLRVERNGGPSAARNLALAGNRDPFVAILDADDEFVPGRFAQIEDGAWDMLADNMLFVPCDHDADLQTLIPRQSRHRQRALGFDEFVASNINDRRSARPELGFMKPVMRRAMLDGLDLRYDEGLRLGEDFVLYARALAGGARVLLSSRFGYIAYASRTSLSWRHRTADLVALRDADRRMIADMVRGGAPPAALDIMWRHHASVTRKIESRVFLDRKAELGAGRALIQGMTRPLGFARIVRDIVRDRLHNRQSPSQLRSLFEQHEFIGSA